MLRTHRVQVWPHIGAAIGLSQDQGRVHVLDAGKERQIVVGKRHGTQSMDRRRFRADFTGRVARGQDSLNREPMGAKISESGR